MSFSGRNRSRVRPSPMRILCPRWPNSSKLLYVLPTDYTTTFHLGYFRCVAVVGGNSTFLIQTSIVDSIVLQSFLVRSDHIISDQGWNVRFIITKGVLAFSSINWIQKLEELSTITCNFWLEMSTELFAIILIVRNTSKSLSEKQNCSY